MFKNTFTVVLTSLSFLVADVYEGYMLYSTGGGGASNTSYYKDWNYKHIIDRGFF